MDKPYSKMNRAEREEYRKQKALRQQSAALVNIAPAPEDIEDSILSTPIAEFEEARPLGDPDTEGDEHALEAEAEEKRLTWRRMLLGNVDAEIADMISDDELREIEAKAREQARNEKKKAALSMVRDSVRTLAQADEGLISKDVIRSEAELKRAMEPVTFRIRIPGGGAGARGRAANIRVDGFEYENNMVYTRPRHIADSIRENIYRAHLNELRFRTLDQHKIGDPYMEAARVLLAQNPLEFEVVKH